MNEYLAKLHGLESGLEAQRTKKDLLRASTKLTEPSCVGFVSDPTRPVFASDADVDSGQPHRGLQNGNIAPAKSASVGERQNRQNPEQRCLQCREVFGPASREVTVRSTSDGRLARVCLDCLSQWLRLGPPSTTDDPTEAA
jgi:hypothetical protein